MVTRLMWLMDQFLRPSVNFVRDHLKELSPTVDNNLAASLMRLLDCYFDKFYPKEGKAAASADTVAAYASCLDELFVFCLVWSVGATTNDVGRQKFDAYLRSEMGVNGMAKQRPPASGDVYACLFDPAQGQWVRWMDTNDAFDLGGSKLNFRSKNQIIGCKTQDFESKSVPHVSFILP